MPIQILMPALSPTMTEGKLTQWLKAEGDAVAPGDVIAEIETDKATMEIEAVEEGTLGRILVAGGTENVPVNTPIAILLEEGEDASALDAVAAPVPTAPISAGAAPLAEPLAAPAIVSGHPPPPSLMLTMLGFSPTPRHRPCAKPCVTRWPRKCAATRRSL